MTPFACSSAAPIEQSLLDYEIYQDAQPEGPSDHQVKRVADFIELHLFRESGRISKEACRAHELFTDLISDAIVEWGDSDDDGISVLSRMALHDVDGVGYELGTISRCLLLEISRDYFDEFADAARDEGFIK